MTRDLEAIIVIAASIGVVWGAILALRGSLIAGCLASLVMTSCFGVNFWSFDVGSITVSLDRLFIAFLAAAWFLQWRIGKVPLKPFTWNDAVLFAFIGTLLISMLAHDWRNAGPSDVPILQHLINGYLIPLTLFWIARQSVLTERSTTLILAVMTLFGVYLSIIGILEAFGQWSLVFPRYIANPELGLHFGRSRGPMVHSVSYGIYLATCLLCLWMWSLRFSWRYQFMMLVTLAPLFCAAIYFTKTRSVWAGAGTGLFFVLMFTLRGHLRVAVLGTMVAAALVVGVTKFDSLVGLKREGTVADTVQSTGMRKSFAYTSWKMFLDRPLFGFGFGQYAQAKLPYLSDRTVDLPLEQIRTYVHHNTFLSVLTETGLFGLFLFLAVLASWMWAAWQLIRSTTAPIHARRHGVLMIAVLGIAFWQMMGHEITFTPIDNSLLYFLAGITIGLLPLAKPAPAISLHPIPATGAFA